MGTVLLIAGLVAPPASAQTDAAAVARSLINAENAHDVNTVVNLFAPGAIVNLPTGVFVGRTEIEQWQRELAAGNFHADITPPVAVTPEIVTFSGTVALDLFRQLGISSMESTWQLTIQLGRVTTFNFDFTPAATARLQAALAGAGGGAAPSGGAASGPASSPATPAATASAGRSLALTGADLRLAGVAMAAIVLGALLLVAGRRHRRVA
jgi:hypothetical protein